MALRLKHPNHAEHSSVQAYSSTWGKICKLNVPPKVCTFLWKACSGCLPTWENLDKKQVRVEAIYELCCHHFEITSHVLWECPFARNVWALFKGTIQKCINDTSDFFLLFKLMQQKLSPLELEEWAITAWMIYHLLGDKHLGNITYRDILNPKGLSVSQLCYELNYVILTTHFSHYYSMWDFTHTCIPNTTHKTKIVFM